MEVKKKLSAWYFMTVFSLVLLITIVYLAMSKIESTTSALEEHIRLRNFSYIVDKDYSLEKTMKKSEQIDFLNDLTDFFYTFHEKTV